MSKNNFIVISNRLPVTVLKQNGKLLFQPSSGGLATAMSSVEADSDHIWVGWPGINSDDLTGDDKKTITKKLKDFSCVPVFLTRRQVENFYEGYSNEGIWPLFHYFQSLARFDEEQWSSYQQVNHLFAEVVTKIGSANSTIWIHDYHLMLLPKMLRKTMPKSSIGFFLHIPFPSFEVFRLLPNRREILEGLLGADLVGFHVYDYVRHFISSVMRTLGYEYNNGSIIYGERVVKSDAFPIGIDYKKFQKASSSAAVKNEIRRLDTHYKNKKLILSVDRLDYSKGIAKRLAAFERFLSRNPRYHKKVTLIVIAVPSRTEVRAYQQLREIIEQAVSRINGAYATSDWVPVAYQFQNLPFNKLVALYARSDIALVTPLRDGMNLVAKEYVASKQNKNGVLILSELTGAVDELSEALIINPNDTNAVVSAIKEALVMPAANKKSRLAAMQKRISSYDVHSWTEDFLEQLKQSKLNQNDNSSKLLSKDKKNKLIKDYKKTQTRLIILDYDGTIRPFVKSIKTEDAAPKKKVLKLIQSLSAKPENTVYIISGRPKKALEKWFGSLPVNLVAEHGYWIKKSGKWQREKVNVKDFKELAKPIMKKYESRTPGAELEDKNSSLVWHYRKVTPELAYVRAVNLKHELNDVLTDSEASVYSGNKILEVKPRNINKGVIVGDIIRSNSYDFVLCCGDDYTDEDMFRALPPATNAYSIKVGICETEAELQIPLVEDMIDLLKALKKAS